MQKTFIVCALLEKASKKRAIKSCSCLIWKYHLKVALQMLFIKFVWNQKIFPQTLFVSKTGQIIHDSLTLVDICSGKGYIKPYHCKLCYKKIRPVTRGYRGRSQAHPRKIFAPLEKCIGHSLKLGPLSVNSWYLQVSQAGYGPAKNATCIVDQSGALIQGLKTTFRNHQRLISFRFVRYCKPICRSVDEYLKQFFVH